MDTRLIGIRRVKLEVDKMTELSMLELAANVRAKQLEIKELIERLEELDGDWTEYALATDEVMRVADDGLRNTWTILHRIERALRSAIKSPNAELTGERSESASMIRYDQQERMMDFDEWSAQPYTKVLQESIAKDYVPRTDLVTAVAAERDAIVETAATLGWGMKNDDPFEDAVREVCDMRKPSRLNVGVVSND